MDILTPDTEHTTTTEYIVINHHNISQQYPYPGVLENTLKRPYSMPCSFKKSNNEINPCKTINYGDLETSELKTNN